MMDLIVDLGQSGARVKIGDEILRLEIAKNTSESVIEAVDRIFHQVPEGSYQKVFLSLTGLLGNVGEIEQFGKLCNSYFNSSEVHVMDDGFAAYLGALGEENGVVLTLGSGVVAVAGNNGRFSHTDGKGPVFGDFGGGFWLGQAGLRRAISTLDERDNASDLVLELSQELEAHAALTNKTGIEAATLCISAAKTVIQAAENGALSAQEILQTAARMLGITVVAAWNKVKGESSEIPQIAFLGGLSSSELYIRLISDEIRSKIDCNISAAKSDHLVGAQLAAKKYPEGVPPLFKSWKI